MKRFFLYQASIKLVAFMFIFCLSSFLLAQDGVLKIDLSKGEKVTPTAYGYHYEEIGMIGEGGLHAELVRNRGFEEANFPKGLSLREGLYEGVPNPTGNNKAVFHIDPLQGWIVTPLAYSPIKAERTLRNPMNDTNPHSMLVMVNEDIYTAGIDAAIHNTGFYGMNFKKGLPYKLSFYVKSNSYEAPLNFCLSDEKGNPVSKIVSFEVEDREWKKQETILIPEKDVQRGMLTLVPTAVGMFQIDMVSMYPSDTWDNGKSIFRQDIMQNLVYYSPDFIRFPGGCIVHGVNEETMYHWKETIGDMDKRSGSWSKWAPFYRTDGLGYHEFYELCEYVGADAMYVTPTGMVCMEFVHPLGDYTFDQKETDVQYYIDDVLDAIEYAIGDTHTKWGGERAKNGHPAPFPLKYVEIGNEDFGLMYYEKYDQIYKAIKAKYPQLVLIANSIIFGELDDKQKYIAEFKEPEKMEVYDEHYYQTINWVINSHYKFDAYDRIGPDLFIGELGIRGEYPKNILAEGVFKLALERNGDVNPLMADRPLMRNQDFLHFNRMVPLLLHSSSESVRTFNFYLCKMLRDNKIDFYYDSHLSAKKKNQVLNVFYTVGKDPETGEIILKLINLEDERKTIELQIPFLKKGTMAEKTLLTAKGDEYNVPGKPEVVKPEVSMVEVSDKDKIEVLPNSFVVYRIKTYL